MKKLSIFISLFITALLFFGACKEVPPYIDFTPKSTDTSLTDTTYVETPVESPQQKNVLIEDFTGASCPNCPKAQRIIDTISMNHPGRIVPVSLHPTGITLTQPHPGSPYDFRTKAAADIMNFLGSPIGLPTGAINRVHFSGEKDALVSYNKYAGYANDQLAASAPVNLYIENTYVPTTRYLKIKITMKYTAATTEENFLSVELIESGMVAPQSDGQTIDTNYVNNHVLRQMVTPVFGQQLNASLVPGRVFIREYSLTLPADYNADNVDVVAFVHEKINSKQVLQVQKKAIK